MIKQKEIKEILNYALSKLYEKELFLIKNNIHERAINHKLAKYIEEVLYEKGYKYDVDVEYNKNYGNEYFKKIIVKIKENVNIESNIYPDIIIHKRGESNNNLLVLELKKYSNNDIENDREKLKALTNSEYFVKGYKYDFGVFVQLGESSEKKCKIELYINGRLTTDF